ncbi:restriction endonuclease subunit S [Methyloversatilis sp.]|uniref:restriction endonuclease subunit S n=1 Tax=Methyloversatilis sp. TaxID=2569862 RepID=UPI0035B04FEA
MSFPIYPEYRDTETQWLGSLPAHWDGQSLKRVVAKIESGVSVNAVDEPATTGSVGVLKTSCVYSGRFDPTENKAVIADELDRVACSVQAQTLIVSRMNTPALVGAAGLVTEDAENLFLPDRLWQVHFTEAVPAFVHYWTASPAYRAQVEMACAGTSASMQNLSQDDFLRFVLPLPSVREQAAISAFLDRETAKIDALIAGQEKLIALLAEKRQTTISHAVTRGLNPDAPMKDSGVPWLGEVPAHWQIGPLKRFAEVIDCKHHTVQFLDEGLPIVSIRELRDDRIDLINAKYTSKDEWDFLREGRVPQKGDLIFCRNASVGAVGYVDGIEDFCMGQDVCLIRPKMDGRFMHLQMCSSLVRSQIESLLVGATIRRANVEEIRSLVVVWPSEGEQQSIADFIQNELLRFRGLADQARSAVNLLQERRSALIAAAVTGQIDVRGAL